MRRAALTLVVLLILGVGGCGSGGGGPTVDAATFDNCLTRDAGAESGTFFHDAPYGAFSDAKTVMTLAGNNQTLDYGVGGDVYVFDDASASETAASSAVPRKDAADVQQIGNVVVATERGGGRISSAALHVVKNCVGEAS